VMSKICCALSGALLCRLSVDSKFERFVLSERRIL